ncbi:MAG: transcription antitermination factor NusB [Qingshengfaniella sp.]
MTDPTGKPRTGKRPLAERRQLKSAARFFAVQALFQMEASGASFDKVVREFTDYRFGEHFEDYDMAEGDPRLFRRIVEDAVSHQARIDQMTDRALVAKWPIARIDPTLRALTRAAGAELVAHETPPKVVIVEYVQIAQAFFPEGREAGFTNAVLDHMAREARPEAF